MTSAADIIRGQGEAAPEGASLDLWGEAIQDPVLDGQSQPLLDRPVNPHGVLDLFSGLRGWSEPWEAAGYDTFTIDLAEHFTADAHLDIGDTPAVMAALPWRPKVVLASPPCNSFSTMTMGRMWTHEGEPKHPLAVQGRRLVLATIRLIALLQPSYWVMENPRARLRTTGLMEGFPRVTVTYCQYGEDRMKPTDLWGHFPST